MANGTRRIAHTITMPDVDRRIRQELAGTFMTTPLDLFVMLDGRVADFNDEHRFIMEWHLRTFGYVEEDVSRSFCAMPTKRAWVRTRVWKEDQPWLDDDDEAILAQIEANCCD